MRLGDQRLAVDLAVGQQRQGGQDQDGVRDHIVGQAGDQARTQGLGVQRQLAVQRLDEQGQARGLGADVQGDGLGDVRRAQGGGGDLGHLDTVAADLDLVVAAAADHHRAVGATFAQVAGVVGLEAGRGGRRQATLEHRTQGQERRADDDGAVLLRLDLEAVRAATDRQALLAVAVAGHAVEGGGLGRLGGAVEIDALDRGRDRADGVDQAAAQHVAAPEDVAQIGQGRRLAGGQQLAQRRGHVGGGRAHGREPGGQAAGRGQRGLIRNMQRRAQAQRRKDVAQHRVMRQARQQGEAVRSPQVEGARLPADEIDQRPVRDRHALGLARAARGEQQIGRSVGIDRRQDHVRRLGGQRHRQARQVRQILRRGAGFQQEARTADVEHLAQAEQGIGQVQHHERRAGAGAGQHGHDQARTARAQDAGQHARCQLRRQSARQGLQFAIGDLALGVGQGDEIRRGAGLGLEPAVDQGSGHRAALCCRWLRDVAALTLRTRSACRPTFFKTW